MENDYDVIIAGGGPAGLAAAIYSARSGVRTVVLESLAVGGVAAATPVIENYPGFESISGFELSQRMEAQGKLKELRSLRAKFCAPPRLFWLREASRESSGLAAKKSCSAQDSVIAPLATAIFSEAKLWR